MKVIIFQCFGFFPLPNILLIWMVVVDICLDWLQLCKIGTHVCSSFYSSCKLFHSFMLIITHEYVYRLYTDFDLWWYMQNNMVSVTSILGGVSDNTGSGIAHRSGNYYNVWYLKYYSSSLWINFLCFSVLKTGLNIILACSIPKNSPILEVCFFSHSQSLIYACT